MKNVVICTEDWAGSGHHMAAIALQQAILERAPGVNVRIVGGVATASPFLLRLSRRVYAAGLAHAPEWWQALYDREHIWSGILRKPLGKVLGKRLLRRLIQQEAPDVVVATHAYCVGALAEAKRKAAKPFWLGAVLTDFHVHGFWIHPEVDGYVVPHEEIARELNSRYSVDADKIHVHGIPVRPPFARGRERDKREWRQQLGLKPGGFTVLILGGEGGHIEMTSVVQRLIQTGRPLQIVVITGRNERLRHSLREQLHDVLPHAVHLLGYEPSIWEWIGAADAIVTKPGGLTCAEALAMGTPLVLFQPLPGQERRNSRFLRDQGVAEEAATPDEIVRILERWQREKRLWQAAAEQHRQFGRPDAAYRTADLLLARKREAKVDRIY